MNVLQVPEREFLAFHEAGHAVMATLMRRPVHRASIRKTHGLTGYVDYKHASSALAEVREEHRPMIETDALILLAGRAAECERTLGSPLSHASLDRQNARALLAALEDSEEVVSNWMRYLLVRAQSLLQQDWPLVHAVAHALMKDEELDGAAVMRVMAEARARLASGERSNVRILIYEDALDSIRAVPQSQCHIPANVLPFPLDRAAAANFAQQTIDEVMHLSSRARKCLARGGIRTLADLARRTICSLAAIHGVGPTTLDEIMAEVSRIGITLAVAGQTQLTWP
jgi:hypothetical protein